MIRGTRLTSIAVSATPIWRSASEFVHYNAAAEVVRVVARLADSRELADAALNSHVSD